MQDPVACQGPGSESRYWRKAQRLRRASWRIENVLHGEGEAAVEWAMTAAGAGTALRGTDWYRFEGGLIAEVRAYFRPDPAGGGLTGFPYAERGPGAPAG